MAKHENPEVGTTSASDISQEQPVSQEQPDVAAEQLSVPFNPFTALSGAELTALASSYNKQWRQAHAVDIAVAMSEYQCSENEAIFFASLRADAAAIMDRAAVNDTVDSVTGLLRGVAFPKQSEVSLAMIEGHYSELKTELRKTAGIRIRDFAHKEWEQATADAIMSKVYKHLGIAEKDWMR